MDSGWWPLCKSRYGSQVTWAKLASWANQTGLCLLSKLLLSCAQSQCCACLRLRVVQAVTLQLLTSWAESLCKLQGGSLPQAAKLAAGIRNLLESNAAM